jgi:hypothetical protein
MKPIYLHVLLQEEDGDSWKEFLLSSKKDPKSAHVLTRDSVRVDILQVPEESITAWMHGFVHAYWQLSDSDEDLIMEVIDWDKFRSILETRLLRVDEYRYNKRHWKSDYLDSEAISFIYNWTGGIEELNNWETYPVVEYYSRDEEEDDGA